MKIKDYIKIIKLIIFFSIMAFDISIADDRLLKEKSIVDWQKGYVESKGKAQITFNKEGIPVDPLTEKTISLNKARELTCNCAKDMAIANMAEAIKYIRVDAQNTFLDVLENNAFTQKIISDRIINYTAYKEYPAGFDVSICIATLNFGDIIASIPYDFPSHDFPMRSDIPISTPYTSLIIDCRGLEIKAMLFPSIYSDTGLEIYGKNFIDSAYAVKGGMVSYRYNEDAQLDVRAGEHPYFAAAIKSINNCPVLSEKDARRILSSQKTINNLKKCRVILIIDKEGMK